MNPALAVDVATKVGEFELSVAFEVHAGVAVLFGPSGAGKSLTIGMVAGLVRPQRGTISIGGHLVDDTTQHIHLRTRERRIGMVFQDGLLLPHRTILDNVALAVRDTRPRRRRREIATDWLDRVGATELARRRPATLSGGQRQRVALARALAGDPALLLLDEPLSALDLAVRQELRGFLRDVVTSAGIPTVMVTHDIEEAEAIGDLIIGFGPGRVTGTRPVLRRTQPSAAADGTGR